MDIFIKILEADSIKAFFVYLFILIILASFIATIFIHDNLKLISLGKIIGGFSVFVFAVISDNSLVKILSIFIGGLLIASEDFMKNLAIIFRSSSGDIAKNLSFKDKPATQIESEEKDESKIQEDTEFIKIESERDSNAIEVKKDVYLKEDIVSVAPGVRKASLEERMIKNKKIENLVFYYLESRFGDRLKRDVKIENKYGFFVADGVLYSRFDSKEISNIVEIKYIEEVNSGKRLHLDFFVRRTLEKIRYLYVKKHLLLIVVAETVDEDFVRRFLSNQKYKDTSFWFFKLEDDQIVKLRCSHLISNN